MKTNTRALVTLGCILLAVQLASSATVGITNNRILSTPGGLSEWAINNAGVFGIKSLSYVNPTGFHGVTGVGAGVPLNRGTNPANWANFVDPVIQNPYSQMGLHYSQGLVLGLLQLSNVDFSNRISGSTITANFGSATLTETTANRVGKFTASSSQGTYSGGLLGSLLGGLGGVVALLLGAATINLNQAMTKTFTTLSGIEGIQIDVNFVFTYSGLSNTLLGDVLSQLVNGLLTLVQSSTFFEVINFDFDLSTTGNPGTINKVVKNIPYTGGRFINVVSSRGPLSGADVVVSLSTFDERAVTCVYNQIATPFNDYNDISDCPTVSTDLSFGDTAVGMAFNFIESTTAGNTVTTSTLTYYLSRGIPFLNSCTWSAAPVASATPFECDGLGNRQAIRNYLRTNGGATANAVCLGAEYRHDFSNVFLTISDSTFLGSSVVYTANGAASLAAGKLRLTAANAAVGTVVLSANNIPSSATVPLIGFDASFDVQASGTFAFSIGTSTDTTNTGGSPLSTGFSLTINGATRQLAINYRSSTVGSFTGIGVTHTIAGTGAVNTRIKLTVVTASGGCFAHVDVGGVAVIRDVSFPGCDFAANDHFVFGATGVSTAEQSVSNLVLNLYGLTVLNSVKTVQFTVQAVDGRGQTLPGSFSIVDSQDPSISCPSDIVQFVVPTAPGAIIPYTVSASDVCDKTVAPVRQAGLASNSLFPFGTTLVSHSATDAAGHSVSCSFNVVVHTCDNDAICDPNEENVHCPNDCKTCDNDGLCETFESALFCNDCKACNGNGVCSPSENLGCPADCGPCDNDNNCDDNENAGFCTPCGSCDNDGICELPENILCPDCNPACDNDGVCEDNESLARGCNDCKPCSSPSNGICEDFENRLCPDCKACSSPSNGICDVFENRRCPDCLACSSPANGICADTENLACPDCQPCNTNNVCDNFENRRCPECLACSSPANGICEPFENLNCPDCKACSSPANGICEDNESILCPDCLPACDNDGLCDLNENRNCPDCKTCNTNGVCSPSEAVYCPDCKLCDNDNFCDPFENRRCPECLACSSPSNGICENFENQNCPDCKPCSSPSNGICEDFEQVGRCPDCSACVNNNICDTFENRLCPDCLTTCDNDGFCEDNENLSCGDCKACSSPSNGVCDAFENLNCPDCKACNTNGFCEPFESIRRCPDCDTCNTNGFCEATENINCPDCKACSSPSNGLCDVFENPSCSDCKPCNKNGICEPFEQFLSCSDCQSCVPNGICDAFEQAVRCPDCQPCDNDAICDDTENRSCSPCNACQTNGVCEPFENRNCPDCKACSSPPNSICENFESRNCPDCLACSSPANGICEDFENGNCPDCNPLCDNDNLCELNENLSCPDCLTCDNDGVCENFESIRNCPNDCKACSTPSNGLCDDFENLLCPDCQNCNANGICELFENSACSDCKPCDNDGTCDDFENTKRCPAECQDCNNNSVCEIFENFGCPDCQTCQNDGICRNYEVALGCIDCQTCQLDGICQDTESILNCADCKPCNFNTYCNDFENRNCPDCGVCVDDNFCRFPENRRCKDCTACNSDDICVNSEHPRCFVPENNDCDPCFTNNLCQVFENENCPDCLTCDKDLLCDNTEHQLICSDCYCIDDGNCQDHENLNCQDCLPCDNDGVCDNFENIQCPDCTACTINNVCGNGENLVKGCADCKTCSTNGYCEDFENRLCPDCQLCSSPPNNLCDLFENQNCPNDCKPCNTNQYCEDNENRACPDCAACVGNGICDYSENGRCSDCPGCVDDGFCSDLENPRCPNCDLCDSASPNDFCNNDENRACTDCLVCTNDNICQDFESLRCKDCKPCSNTTVCSDTENQNCSECLDCVTNDVCEDFESARCVDCNCDNDKLCELSENLACISDCGPCVQNGICTDSETIRLCPNDCQTCFNNGTCEDFENRLCDDCELCNFDGLCDDFENRACSDCGICNYNGFCEPFENYRKGCTDCGPCVLDAVCDVFENPRCPECICNFDGLCQSYESLVRCTDCKACDGDGTCDDFESVLDCPNECDYCNYNGTCETYENRACPDCRGCDGDGYCEPFEKLLVCSDCDGVCTPDGDCGDGENTECNDCGTCNRNRVCEPFENGGCPDCQPPCNGDGVCGPNEKIGTCSDCKACDDNGVCESFENVLCGDCRDCVIDGVCKPSELLNCPDCPNICNNNGICDRFEVFPCLDCPGTCDPSDNFCEDRESSFCCETCSDDGICQPDEPVFCTDCSGCVGRGLFAPPVITNSPSTIQIVEGFIITDLEITFTDLAERSPWFVYVDWFGDGNKRLTAALTTAGTVKLGFSPVYLVSGPYTATITIQSRCGIVSQPIQLAVDVQDAPPVINGNGRPFAISEGNFIPAANFPVITFVDQLSDGPFTAEIDWKGTGTFVPIATFSGTSFSLPDSVVYEDGPQSINANVRVTDRFGVPSATFKIPITVVNTNPTHTAPTTITVDEGSTLIPFTVDFSDPADSFDAPYVVRVAYNNDAPFSASTASSSPVSFNLPPQNLLVDNGIKVINSQVRDKDFGLSTVRQTRLVVKNVAPTIDPFPSIQINEGQVVDLSVNFRDVGLLDSHQLFVTFGNQPVLTTSSSPTGFVTRSATFPTSAVFEDGTKGVPSTVTVIDKDGDSATLQFVVTVLNLPPVFVNPPTSVLITDDGVVLPDITVTDPGINDGLEIVVEWGDGSTSPGTVRFLPGGVRSVSVEPHVYCSTGSFVITIVATDSDGGIVRQTISTSSAPSRGCTNGVDCCSKSLGVIEGVCATVGCSATRGCFLESAPRGTPCDDQCTLGYTCSGTGVCNAPVSGPNFNSGAECEDGNLCTVDDKCDAASRTCKGSAKVCPNSDGNSCTVDFCDPTDGVCRVNVVCATPAPTQGLGGATRPPLPPSVALPTSTPIPSPSPQAVVRNSASALSPFWLFALVSLFLLGLFQ